MPPKSKRIRARQASKFRSHLIHLIWLLPLFILGISGLTQRISVWRVARSSVADKPSDIIKPAPPPPVWTGARFPVDIPSWRTLPLEKVFQPTASGRIESALFGSVRTNERGQPRFHEGIDIAPQSRDARREPLDMVIAIAPGRVAYANRIQGRSDYGRYIVLEHADPLGPIYTLYGHLARIEDRLQPGVAVAAGEPVGLMGRSSSTPIPIERAHLHFEVDVQLNRRFARWAAASKYTNDHLDFNGRNLYGVDPLLFLNMVEDHPGLDMQAFLGAQPVAFEMVTRPRTPIDYFARYRNLWKGSAWDGQPVTMGCTANGIPLWGRTATPEEKSLLGSRTAKITRVDEAVLGRNGSRLIARDSKGWTLGPSGETWRQILLY
jgi:hypothetical protein